MKKWRKHLENKGMVFKIIWDLWTTTLITFKFCYWNIFTLLYLYHSLFWNAAALIISLKKYVLKIYDSEPKPFKIK